MIMCTSILLEHSKTLSHFSSFNGPASFTQVRQTPMMTPSARTPANPFATPGNPLSTPQYQATPRGQWPASTPGGGGSGNVRTPGSSYGGSSVGGGKSANDWASLAEQWARGGAAGKSGGATPQSGRDRRSPRGPPPGHSPYAGGSGSSGGYRQSPHGSSQSHRSGGGGGGHSPYGGGRQTPGTPRSVRTPRRTPGTPRDPRDGGGGTPLWDETF